ncbi:TPM domain-containing protein [Sphingomonas bacterium]|uniref:TPM domain-containing protein n=1 Tax=Sphingomonas bacterium TaxID=1895847 RepID=UPI0015757E8D|nr:TPM domain-containing protein [Sphingomonas bacterium]
MSLTQADRTAVVAAVTAAETTTDAEIVPIVAAQSDAYHDAAVHWITIALFLIVAVTAFVPQPFLWLLDRAYGGWGDDWSMGALFSGLLLLLAVAYLVLHYATKPLAIRMALTPGATKTRRVRARAVLLFRTAIEARTATRTGVLLYVSLAERRAEIVTDAAVLAKVPATAWGEAMHALVDALKDGRTADAVVAAIGRIGTVLAEYFPYTGTDPNELPDQLIEL